MAVDPSGRFVYVANASSDDVTTFRINVTTGELTEVGSPVAAGHQPVGVAVDPSGHFVYVTNSLSNDLSTFKIDATTGALTQVGTNTATGTFPSGVVVVGFDD